MTLDPNPIDIDPSAMEVPEGAPQPDLDVLVREWQRIATVAWDGFIANGRGAVLVEPASPGVKLSYVQGEPCPCHADVVRDYDPQTQVIALLEAQPEGGVYVLNGWPPPPTAWQVTPAVSAEVLPN